MSTEPQVGLQNQLRGPFRLSIIASRDPAPARMSIPKWRAGPPSMASSTNMSTKWSRTTRKTSTTSSYS